MLIVSSDLRSYYLSAGEPWLVQVQLLAADGSPMDIDDDSLIQSFYKSGSREVIEQIEGVRDSDAGGEFFRFERSGLFSDGMFNQSIRVELARRYLDGRQVIGDGELKVATSAASVPSLPGALFGDVATRITIRSAELLGAAPLISLTSRLFVPFVSGSDTTPSPSPTPSPTPSPSPTPAPSPTPTPTPTPMPASVHYIAEGDSNSTFHNDTSRWPAVMLAALPSGPTYSHSFISTPGIGAHDILFENNGQNGFERRAKPQINGSAAVNLLTNNAGTNDNAEENRFRVYRDLRQENLEFRRAVLTAGSQPRCVGLTLPSRDDDPNFYDRSFDAATLPLNLLMRSRGLNDMGLDGLVDLGADPRFDTASDTADATIYNSDKLHFTDGGYAAIAALAEPVVEAALRSDGTVPNRLGALLDEIDFSTGGGMSLNSARTTATGNGFSGYTACLEANLRRGKWAWEFILDNKEVAVGLGVWAGRIYQTNGQTDMQGNDARVGYDGRNGQIQINGNVLATPGIAQAGQRVLVHLDVDAKRLWMSVNGGAHNGNAQADPATGAGGVDVSSVWAVDLGLAGKYAAFVPMIGSVHYAPASASIATTAAQMSRAPSAGFMRLA